ncbi:MAG: flavodoxin-dependent (E)-4-hydroxy-3-methylbut-2-enyl-diphosphate synthase [Christensenellaceae bacterium]|nr:flavodoxin-dependent (E)-4-hydroxy-3-methylbut-2-enyl-diphosphate synthase [Christensenellaceae bacterium]
MTNAVKIGDITIGGGAPVAVQTMTNTLTTDISATVSQISRCYAAGASLVRVSVPDIASVEAFRTIALESPVPLIADVHYDYKIALKAIEYGAKKIRINPGNTSTEGLKEIARVAKEAAIPIRVGVNKGSLKGDKSPRGLATATLDAAKLFEDLGATALVLAVKSSDIRETVEAYTILSKLTEHPLHIGLTEAGTYRNGSIKSSVAIGALLLNGIGDTVRVSLTGAPESEITCAYEILNALGLKKTLPDIISCPTCARTQINVEEVANGVFEAVKNSDGCRGVKIAVMGCAVNGINESKGAKYGVCGGKEKSLLFKDGVIVKEVENSAITSELLNLIKLK